MTDVSALSESLQNAPLAEGLRLISGHFGRVVFSTSMGQEDQVITDAIFGNKLPISIFTLDTGRLFQETYELIDATRARYAQPIEVFFPDTQRVQQLTQQKGMNSFYNSVADRKECCYIRKIEPLKRALAGADVWVTGLRAEQSDNRADMQILEWDEGNKVWKYNPLISWTYADVLAYLQAHKVPDNPLHRRGFVSIGCAPCTRAIAEGEHPRAGRWWWEASQKECGLHAS
jgi:phosphoadenosine phosphosulfate reductase